VRRKGCSPGAWREFIAIAPPTPWANRAVISIGWLTDTAHGARGPTAALADPPAAVCARVGIRAARSELRPPGFGAFPRGAEELRPQDVTRNEHQHNAGYADTSQGP
jgi:hypothetical protein